MYKTMIVFAALFLMHFSVLADQVVEVVRSEIAPVVDGNEDALWSQVPEVITSDSLADIDITLKALYTDDQIFFLVRFPDATESREHKTLVWNPDLELYKVGSKREDVLVLKWHMGHTSVDLSLSAEQPYKADIWYWKAHRTDHAGYADDKYQIYSHIAMPKSQPLVAKNGKIFYLARRGDQGVAAYEGQLQADYAKPEMPAFIFRKPEGSRGDVHAKGRWHEGYWTVEFSRLLSTGHADDVALDINHEYHFGVSRYEIAGRKPNPKVEQPNFGSGDITENLILHFKQ